MRVAVLATLSLIEPKQSKTLPALIKLTKPEITVGRKKTCDVVLVDNLLLPKMISRVHANLVSVKCSAHGDMVWKVIDNNSTNGVLVNRVKVHEQILKDGDIVHFGGGTGINISDVQRYLGNCKAIAYSFRVSAPKVRVLVSSSY